MSEDIQGTVSGENINEKSTEDKDYGNHQAAVDDRQSEKEAEKSIKENQEGIPQEGQEALEEGCEACSKETETAEDAQKDACQEKGDSKEIPSQINDSGPQSAYSYTPPKSTSGGDQDDGQKKKKRSLGIGILAVIIAIALAVTSIGGGLSVIAVNGVIWILDAAKNMAEIKLESNSGGDSGQPSTGELPVMNIIKNDNPIKIDLNVQEGPTGYPEDMTIPQVVERVSDTVVEIITTKVVNDIFYGQHTVQSGAGSGVIITTDGYIVTNYHVIDGARTATVRLTNGSEFAASYVFGDAEKDLAIIKIDATGLTRAVMGSSKALVVGQDVIAIGNPLGTLGGTVTDGIISALDRNIIVDGHEMTLMQTNAAINPGNSGGGLFNRAGELVGIVNAKQVDTGIEGLGFAIPIDVVLSFIEGVTNTADSQ